MTTEELKDWAWRRIGWKDAEDQFPHDGETVATSYPGVYHNRKCTFWRDAGGNAHYGKPNEPDGKGSQPTKWWRRLSSNVEAMRRERRQPLAVACADLFERGVSI